MKEYNGRINVLKEEMLFVTNWVFGENISDSTTKENILKMVPQIYNNANAIDIIKLLPYDAYCTLEKLIKYLKTNNDIEKFCYSDISNGGIYYLEQAMIIVMRAKQLRYNYSLNPGVIENISKIFSEDNKQIAEEYGKIEKLTIGMLYSYGVVEYEFFRKSLCKYMGKDISEEELKDLYFKRLNLNLLTNYFGIEWTNNKEHQKFITYLDDSEIDVTNIAVEQKNRGLDYKHFSMKELLSREEYLFDDNAKKLLDFLNSNGHKIYKGKLIQILKRNELGEKVLENISKLCKFEDIEECKRFMELFIKWYNNSPQYILGGYSPVELAKKYYKI